MNKRDVDNPKVSIVIPVFNGENYLGYAIDSALNQTYENIEIIVVNDGSTDNTDKICKGYGDKIRYFAKENGGVASALNLAIEKMDGKYFSWLSHDDAYKPDKIEKEVEALRKLDNKQTVILSDAIVTDESLQTISETKLSPNINKSPRSFLALDIRNGINGCGLLIPKTLLKKYGGFDESLLATQDYDLWYKMAEKEPFYLVQEPLVYHRLHENQGSKVIRTVPEEVDALHTRFIDDLTIPEYNNYTTSTDNTKSDVKNIFEDFVYAVRSTGAASALLMKDCEANKNMPLLNEFAVNNLSWKDVEKFNKRKNGKRNLLVFSECFAIGGLERSVSTTINALCDEYNTVFVTKNYDPELSYKFNTNVLVINLREQDETRLACSMLALCRLLNIDLFIGTHNINISTLKIYEKLTKYGIKTISSNHYDYLLACKVPFIIPTLEYRDIAYKNNLVTVWKNMQSTKIAQLIHKNAYYIPNPLPFDIVKDVKPFGKTLLAIGRLDDLYKRFDLTLLAFKRIYQEEPKAHLLVVGKVDLEHKFESLGNKTIMQFVSENALDDAIEWIGEQKSVLKYYKKADVLLTTSATEGLGMTALEGLSQGLAIASFNVSGLRDIVDDGRNGFLIADGNLESYASGVLKILRDKTLQQQMKKNSVQKAKKFEEKTVIDMWRKLLSNVFGEKKVIFNLSGADMNLSQIIHEYESALVDLYKSKPDIITIHDEYLPIYRRALRHYRQHGAKSLVKTTVKHILRRK